MNSKENFTRMKIDVCITKNIGARNHARTVTTQLTRVVRELNRKLFYKIFILFFSR